MTLREALEAIRDDAQADAEAPVPFTALGIGTTRGEILAQVHHLAVTSLQLLDRLELLEALHADALHEAEP